MTIPTPDIIVHAGQHGYVSVFPGTAAQWSLPETRELSIWQSANCWDRASSSCDYVLSGTNYTVHDPRPYVEPDSWWGPHWEKQVIPGGKPMCLVGCKPHQPDPGVLTPEPGTLLLVAFIIAVFLTIKWRTA